MGDLDLSAFVQNKTGVPCGPLFSKQTQAIVFNYKKQPIQRMLDFDFVCEREAPSVAAIVAPGSRSGGFQKAFFGRSEIAIPVYGSIADAAAAHPKADVLVNFASYRSAYESSVTAVEEPSVNVVVIIAEGIPERQAKLLIHMARKRGKTIIGPATVGGVQAGAFKIGDTAGTLDNIITCKLHRPGSVGFVSKSGGLSNEMYNVLSRTTDGLYEGIAVGGDAYPGTTLSYHVARFQTMDEVKMIVILGELGGTDEYDVVKLMEAGLITKPVVGWVSGTCAKWFNSSEVQFGHAGAKSGSADESAEAKNDALRKAGVIIPQSFEGLSDCIDATFKKLVAEGKHVPVPEREPRTLPKDFGSALKQGELRVSTNIVCTTTDDRGEEPKYCGVPISDIIQDNYSIGEVISLLWFKTLLPQWATKFMEIVLVTAADHGPNVSGAHNTIVTARAGRDLGASLCSGLLTIGPRFGGAVDMAAINFKHFCDAKISPPDFVETLKKKGQRVEGIGHRIKTAENRDKRVELLSAYAKETFPSIKYLEYAQQVEAYTLQKANNLVLNIDGCIGALFVDMLSSCGEFNEEEVQEILELGALNGIFILSRSIGLIGHALDQKRMRQPLYRHPQEDVLYIASDAPPRGGRKTQE
ncbi:ATP-citrate synthase beta chain protein 1 [Porphyridium purpureum]|uniref:ATP citrate synthase n=1 Tax=Porphyridium purpureum TaxID=35688 RepID=A0A5J4YQH0_PORPP|nr:ATP-citrate synthase beta chain protein 1 [Porphyridium purpureum]|eukprot:POR6066..scf236_6